MTTVEKLDEPVAVDIHLPLPLDVLTTIMNLIGTAYPGAEMATDSVSRLGGKSLRLLIPQDERFKNKTSKKRILAAKQYREDENEALLTEIKQGQPTFSAGEFLGTYMGAMAEQAFEEAGNPTNYIELEVINPATGRTWLVTVARSEGQRPSELHAAAQQEIEQLQNRVKELEAP